jgi:pimeloyl-ACP methyl ester carboxylesterase
MIKHITVVKQVRSIALLGIFLGALVGAPVTSVYAENANQNANPPCKSVQLPVALAAGQPADQVISGTFCKPLRWSGTHEIDVLAHGGTYNRTYWDYPYHNLLYSYVNDTLAAGRATFAYDAIGAGASSHPVSTVITGDASAYVMHQVVQWARHQQHFPKVVTIGHSFGGFITVAEAAKYHDVDGVVATGVAHALNPNTLQLAIADSYPANLDPQFQGKNLDSGYLTTVPNTRADVYFGATAEPGLIAYDEAHKDTLSLSMLSDILGYIQTPAAQNISAQVTAPVLEIIGQEDAFYCGTGAIINCNSPALYQAYEAPYYPSAASLTTKLVPNTGHDLTLHPSAWASFSTINQWIQHH